MRTVRLFRDSVELIETVMVADSSWLRIRGLLGRGRPGVGKALQIVPCNSIHTFFMPYSLDVLFLGRDMVVRRTAWDVPPNRIVFGGLGSWSVSEMEAGWVLREALVVGARLSLA